MSFIIVYSRPWYKNLPRKLEKRTGKSFVGIDNKKDLNRDSLNRINPEHMFFPHWSYLIPEEIYKNFNCIIFHMTDLPYGRGGSPLQNLIVRGHKNTMISAIQCVKDFDAGPVYLKKPLSLEGNAKDIFTRASHIIEEMIIEILDTNPKPVAQKGKVVKFTRRKMEDGDLRNAESLDEVYNYIRMLDADGYPPAFVRFGDYKLEFSRASQEAGAVDANVKITKETGNE
tara:strand:+ start:3591 stop:4274 length:684 start_codon:yes stop_codon:yes gene_type:complete